MNVKKLTGLLMFLLPFIVLFVFLSLEIGVKQVLMLLSIGVGGALMIVKGIDIFSKN